MKIIERASMTFARQLFTRGTDIFGAEEIKKVFGLEIDVPLISATENELHHARKFGQMLVYQPQGITMRKIHELVDNKTSDSRPLLYSVDWYANKSFYTSESLRPGWRLITRELIPGSRNKNYLDQTQILCDYVGQVFGSELPDIDREAIAEFQSQKKELVKLLNSDWQEVARRPVGLRVNQLYRESPAEALWSLTLYEGVNHERLLSSGSWSWTNELSSSGGIVGVGGFGEDGVGVYGDDPGYSYGSRGVRFSRSL